MTDGEKKTCETTFETTNLKEATMAAGTYRHTRTYRRRRTTTRCINITSHCGRIPRQGCVTIITFSSAVFNIRRLATVGPYISVPTVSLTLSSSLSRSPFLFRTLRHHQWSRLYCVTLKRSRKSNLFS